MIALKQTFGRRGPAKFLIFFLIIPNIYIINIVFKKLTSSSDLMTQVKFIQLFDVV